MTHFEHTIGDHSDDRGGDSDRPCYCTRENPQPMPFPSLNTGDTDIDIWVLVESLAYVPRNRHDETATFNLAELRAAITKKLNEARIDERTKMQVELYKYPVSARNRSLFNFVGTCNRSRIAELQAKDKS